MPPNPDKYHAKAKVVIAVSRYQMGSHMYHFLKLTDVFENRKPAIQMNDALSPNKMISLILFGFIVIQEIAIFL